MSNMSQTAEAPASIGNVAVGFDMLGQAFPVAFDRVTATRLPETGARLGRVSGLVTALPEAVAQNTALRAAQAVLDGAQARFGVRLDIDKGVPLSAGMGGSAASAVAATLAVNALLDAPFGKDGLLAFALEGEAASAANPPVDNVAASLHGGLTLIYRDQPLAVTSLPVPEGLACVLIHPEFKVETRAARQILKPEVPLSTLVAHARNVAGFVDACHRGDLDLLKACLRDVVVEPQRADLVPFFRTTQQAALKAGALGCSLSGSGPSIFAWAREPDRARIQEAMVEALERQGVGHTAYSAPLTGAGARVLGSRERGL